MKKKYCRECGSKLKEVELRRYNEITGKKETAMSCQNLKCEDGCANVTGHNNWSSWRNKCLDCGYTIIDF